MSLQRVVKPKTHKGKKIIQNREPKIIENDKNCIFVRGSTINNTLTDLLKDLTKIKKPNSVFYSRKHEFKPMEDVTGLEFLCQKSDASLFAFGSHTKKRPNNLIFGRVYHNHILDMAEFQVDNVKFLSDFQTPKISIGSKPILLFAGHKASKIRLSGLEHVMSFTVAEGKIYIRSYKLQLKKSGTRLPRVELNEIGPNFDLTLRRNKFASESLFKLALKQPKEAKIKKKKNINISELGTTFGRVHMARQDYGELQTRKLKGLKGSLKRAGEQTDENVKQENESEETPAKKKVRFVEV